MLKLFTVGIVATVLSGCVVNVVSEPIYQPVRIGVPSSTFCQWVEIPVYGYADIHRGNGVWVRVQQVAYVDRQWRCN